MIVKYSYLIGPLDGENTVFSLPLPVVHSLIVVLINEEPLARADFILEDNSTVRLSAPPAAGVTLTAFYFAT